MSEMCKIFSAQNMQHLIETFCGKKSNLAKILGHMARISQTFIIVFIKELIKNITWCRNSNA